MSGFVGGRRRLSFARARELTLLVSLVLAMSACGGKANGNSESSCPSCAGGQATNPESSGGAAALAGAGGGASGAGGVTAGAPNRVQNAFGCPGVSGERNLSGCGVQYSCDQILYETHTYLLIERSAKMLEPWGSATRWQYLTDGLSEYKLLNGGLAFSGAAVTTSSDVCDAANYEAPFALFDANGDGSPTLMEALALAPPTGGNPMLPAVEGLLAFIGRLPPEASAVYTLVILTATSPDECPNGVTTADLARVLAGARSTPRVRTVLIELGASYDVDPLSLAAGTHPFRIGPDEAPSRLVDALHHAYPLGCGGAFELPSPPDAFSFDLDGLRVGIHTNAGHEFFPRVSGPEACATSASGGFYLDPPQTPVRALLCPCSFLRAGWGSSFMEIPCKRLSASGKNGEYCSSRDECASTFCYGRAPVAGALPGKTCNECLAESRYDQWCEQDWDCCAGLHCGSGERAGLCVR